MRNLTLSTANGARTLTFNNNSTTPGQSLTFAGTMTTANTGTKTISVGGVGNTTISGSINNQFVPCGVDQERQRDADFERRRQQL